MCKVMICFGRTTCKVMFFWENDMMISFDFEGTICKVVKLWFCFGEP